MRLHRAALPGAIASLALLTTACSGAPAGSPAAPEPGADASEPVAIATTTQWGSVLSDITQCAGATSATLMAPGDDPHEFSVSSSEVANLVKTKLVVANGLGLEEGLASTLNNAAKDGANVFEVAPLVDPLPFAELETEDHQHTEGDGHDHGADGHTAEQHSADDGHDHGPTDPHVYMDVARVAQGAGLIGGKLAEVTGDQKFAECGDRVKQELTAVDGEMREIMSVIPNDRRVLITDHEAYNYFATAYDFEVAGVVIPGGGTDAEPSSAELASLVDTIKHDGVNAIFSNNTVNPRLVDAVAKESGTQIKVVELYEGSVGPAGSGADTYQGMMLTDAHRVADALKQ